MKLNELFADDDAVSPVIGVILMVAITVILAAVIGTFVLGLGSEVQDTPRVDFTVSEDGNELTMTHDGGDPIGRDNIEVIAGNGSTVTGCSNGNGWGGDTELKAGSSCSADFTDSGTLRITWESDDGSSTGTLTRYDYETS
jgi:flagellin-like protein